MIKGLSRNQTFVTDEQTVILSIVKIELLNSTLNDLLFPKDSISNFQNP